MPSKAASFAVIRNAASTTLLMTGSIMEHLLLLQGLHRRECVSATLWQDTTRLGRPERDCGQWWEIKHFRLTWVTADSLSWVTAEDQKGSSERGAWMTAERKAQRSGKTGNRATLQADKPIKPQKTQWGAWVTVLSSITRHRGSSMHRLNRKTGKKKSRNPPGGLFCFSAVSHGGVE